MAHNGNIFKYSAVPNGIADKVRTNQFETNTVSKRVIHSSERTIVDFSFGYFEKKSGTGNLKTQ